VRLNDETAYDHAMSLEPGLTREDEFTVKGPLLTDVGGTLRQPVLSTPGMISMMERNAAILAGDELPEGEGTVGFEVCVKHVGGVMEGATCTVHAKLTEVIDGRKLRFDVEVREGDRTLGVGTHERRVIHLDAHAKQFEP
jgi:fluoroacetyl-CoA thioesterase